MGLFDKLFGKKDEQTVDENSTRREEYESHQIPLKFQQSNELVEYELFNRDSNKFYDTTKVKISRKPLIVNGEEVYKLEVSWYGSSDAIYISDGDGYRGRRDDYETVYAGIDLEKLQSDIGYLKFALEELLDQDRVQRYLKISEKTIPEINDEIARTGNTRIYPCGRYVGGVKETDRGFSKVFDPEVGRYCHELPEMQQQREEKRNSRIARQQAEIARKEAELAKLKAELGKDIKSGDDGR